MLISRHKVLIYKTYEKLKKRFVWFDLFYDIDYQRQNKLHGEFLDIFSLHALNIRLWRI